MIYLDSSALVTLISQRENATELAEFLAERRGTPMATSTIGFVETVRTLDRVGTFPNVMGDLLQLVTEVMVTEEVRDTAAVVPSRVRTLDALHIASAQLLGDALDVLVSYDRRMLETASSMGLPVVAPGLN